MKIAIVTDWLTNYGGAESVISAFHDLFPNSPIYTTMYKPKAMRELGKIKDIRTTYLDKIPFVKHQWMLGFMPTAIEMMNLDEFDIVLSSCHSVSKGIITKPSTLHICYCHTPMRYAWESWDLETRLKRFPRFLHGIIRKQIDKIREWDYCASKRVDEYIANSNYTSSQIKKYYKEDSSVIYPPVRSQNFKKIDNPTNDFYFAAGRLIPYKKFTLLVETFNENGLPLKIAGTGNDYEKLKKMAKPNVEILGRVSDEKLKDLYANCKAFLFPQVEDAGIVPLEAMISGRPVIAFNRGGSLDTMIEDKTGVFFEEQTAESLNKAIKRFETMKFDSDFIHDHAAKYDIEIFKDRIRSFVEEKWEKFHKK